MKMHRTYLIIASCLLLAIVTTGQDLDEDSNWYREIGRAYDGYSSFDFTRYTKDEALFAKKKYLQIESDGSLDEWEGLYTRETMLGRAELIWSSRHGFVYAYIYHTLANIDYGQVVRRDGDSILLVSDRKTPARRSRFIDGDHVRVRFGERHLLVSKNILKDFALYAAGLDVPDRRDDRVMFTEDGYVWEKVDDENKKLADVPVLPALYSHLIRRPIRSRVLSIGRLRIKREYSSTSESAPYIQHRRTITLSSGSRQRVRVGMTFWIDELEERVEVVSVGGSQSAAVLVRPIIDGREFCRNDDEPGDTEPFPCRDPKIGMQARTKTKYF